MGDREEPDPLYQDVFTSPSGGVDTTIYFCQEHYEENLKHICHTCGEKLNVNVKPRGNYRECMLDKNEPGGVREIYFCEEHWHAWHRRYQEPN